MPTAAIIMGITALGSGAMGALGSSSAAAAQAEAAKIQQQQINFRNQWQNEANNRNLMRAYQANLERNILIEKGANLSRALQEFYLDKTFSNQKGTLSKNTNAANAQFLGTMGNRNIGYTSGTAKALMRQSMSVLTANMMALKTNYRQSYKDIQNAQNQQLSERQFSFQEQTAFLPTTGGIADTSSTALITGMLAAGISGIGAGVSTQLKYGDNRDRGGGQGGGQGGVPVDLRGFHAAPGGLTRNPVFRNNIQELIKLPNTTYLF
jgi:hypothetical protein